MYFFYIGWGEGPGDRLLSPDLRIEDIRLYEIIWNNTKKYMVVYENKPYNLTLIQEGSVQKPPQDEVLAGSI